MTHPSHPFRVEALCPVPLGPMPTTGTLSPWALRPLGDPVVVCQVRSTFRVSVHPLPPAHCRVCPAGRSRRRSAHPRETGIRVFSVIPDGGRSHPLGLEFKQSSLTPAWPNSRTSLGPRRWASRRFIRMLLSPQSFRTKVSGSFYPPSSSGVGTLPTRPDKPLPRRTASVDWTDALAACWPGTRYHVDRIPPGHLCWTVPGNPRGIGPEPTAPRSAGLPTGDGG